MVALALVYPTSGAVNAALAAVSFLAPEKYLSILGITATSHSSSAFQLSGALSIVLAVAAYRCYNATTRGTVNSDTYQRLTLALTLAHGAMAYFVYPIASSLTLVGKAIFAANAAVAAGLFMSWVTASSRPTAILKDAFATVGDVLTVPSSVIAGVYSAAAVGFAYAAFTFFTGAPAGHVATDIARHIVSLKFASLAMIAYTLKDGADRNRLGRGTFKELNDGVALTAAAIAYVFYQAAGSINPIIASLIGLAGFTAVLSVKTQQTAGTNSVGNPGEYQYEKIPDPLEKFCAEDPNAEECRVFDD